MINDYMIIMNNTGTFTGVHEGNVTDIMLKDLRWFTRVLLFILTRGAFRDTTVLIPQSVLNILIHPCLIHHKNPLHQSIFTGACCHDNNFTTRKLHTYCQAIPESLSAEGSRPGGISPHVFIFYHYMTSLFFSLLTHISPAGRENWWEENKLIHPA